MERLVERRVWSSPNWRWVGILGPKAFVMQLLQNQASSARPNSAMVLIPIHCKWYHLWQLSHWTSSLPWPLVLQIQMSSSSSMDISADYGTQAHEWSFWPTKLYEYERVTGRDTVLDIRCLVSKPTKESFPKADGVRLGVRKSTHLVHCDKCHSHLMRASLVKPCHALSTINLFEFTSGRWV